MSNAPSIVMGCCLLQLINFGCYDRNIAAKDETLIEAKEYFYQTAFHFMSNTSLHAEGKMPPPGALMLTQDEFKRRSNISCMALTPDLRSWEVPPDCSRSNELAIIVQRVDKTHHKKDFFLLTFDGLIKRVDESSFYAVLRHFETGGTSVVCRFNDKN